MSADPGSAARLLQAAMGSSDRRSSAEKGWVLPMKTGRLHVLPSWTAGVSTHSLARLPQAWKTAAVPSSAATGELGPV